MDSADWFEIEQRMHGIRWSQLKPLLEDLRREHQQLLTELQQMTALKDSAYLERNQVVAALAKSFPSGIAKTAIEGWSEDWHGCVYIDLPTGQASWHYHDSQAYLFEGLPVYEGQWDGHDTPQKYQRLSQMAYTGTSPTAPQVPAESFGVPGDWIFATNIELPAESHRAYGLAPLPSYTGQWGNNGVFGGSVFRADAHQDSIITLLPSMCRAFLVTEDQSPSWKHRMIFEFPTLEQLHQAYDEWLAAAGKAKIIAQAGASVRLSELNLTTLAAGSD
jgi:hypothetical protein